MPLALTVKVVEVNGTDAVTTSVEVETTGTVELV